MLQIAVEHLAGEPGSPTLVVGPSLGTRVSRLWGAAVAELSGYDVLGWDLPGHGTSPATDEAFTIAGLAEAVLRAVGAAGATGPFLYAGDSIGGAVGLQLLLDHAERVTTAAVLCSGARIGTAEGWAERAALVRAEGMAPMVDTSPGRWFGSRVRDEPTPAARAAVADLAEVDPESYARVCEALASYDVRDRLPSVEMPVLFLAGADDVATPADDHQAMARTVRNGRFAVLRGVGHLPPLEDPRRTAALLREHFALAGAAFSD